MRNIALDRVRRIVRENLIIVSGMIVAVFSSLILVKVLTHHLSPTQYGELALGLTLANLVNQTIMCGVISGVGRFYSIALERRGVAEYLTATYQLLRYATVAIVLLGVGLSASLLFFNQTSWVTLLVTTILFSIASSYNGVYSDIQNAARHRGIVSIHSSLDSVLKIIFAIAFLYVASASSLVAMLAYCASAWIVLISHTLFLQSTITGSHKVENNELSTLSAREWRDQIWSYAWPFSTWGIFTWAQQSSDRWALQLFGTTSEVGVYSVLFQLGYVPVMMLSGLASGFLTPIFFQRAGASSDTDRHHSVRALNQRVSLVLLCVTLLATLGAMALHEVIFLVLVSAAYREYSHLLPWFVLAGGFFATGQMFALQLMSEVRSRRLLPVKITTALIGSGLNIAGAWLAGLHGIVAALVIFSGSYLIWTAWIARAPALLNSH